MNVEPIDLQSDAILASRNHPLLVGLGLLPYDLRKSVGTVQGHLKRTDPRHIYHPAVTLHITVKPVGSLGVQVDRGDLGEVKVAFRRVASEFRSFEVALEGLALFPDVVYAKVTDGKKDIVELNKALSESLGELAIQGQYEGDRMIPHVTLATFTNSSISELLAEVRRTDRLIIGRMTLNRIHLMKAHLHRYYGDESVRTNAFQRVEVFQLKTP